MWRCDYNTGNTFDSVSDIAQVTTSPFTSTAGYRQINNSSTPSVEFRFPSESIPPYQIIGYFYNANTDKYVISTFGLGNNSYVIGQGFTSTVAGSVATNDFFTNFSNSYGIELNLNPGNFGGSKKNLPPVFVHANIMFVFPA